MVDLCGEISGRPKLCDILLCNGGSHPSALGARSEHDGKAESNGVEPWVLELGVGKAEEKFGVKKMALGSFIKASGIERLLLKPKNQPIPTESFSQDGWVTHARIDENPAIRGHNPCFDKTCQ